MNTIIFSPEKFSVLAEGCESRYPYEACGLLFQDISSQSKKNEVRVHKIEFLSNLLQSEYADRLKELMQINHVTLPKERIARGGKFEFILDPNEHCKMVLKNEKMDLDQIGIFHSHPDHPPKPSTVDESQPFLMGWSSVIVSIYNGKFKAVKSWRKETESSPFFSENVIIQ